MVVDGNMQLVHLWSKRPDDDVSLSDGDAFMVKRAPYARHIASVPDKQPVRASRHI
jgi:hypothetical protein